MSGGALILSTYKYFKFFFLIQLIFKINFEIGIKKNAHLLIIINNRKLNNKLIFSKKYYDNVCKLMKIEIMNNVVQYIIVRLWYYHY